MKRALPFLLLSLLASAARADTYTVVLQTTNGYRVPRIIGASGSIDSDKGFSGFDYFEWFGITHHRYWFRLGASTLNPTGGVTNVASFDAATALVRADPWRQGTASNVYIDWNYFHGQFGGDYQLQRFGQLGIEPMMINTTFTDQDPLADWGNKFKYWKTWYAFVYYFASQYGVTMFEFRNEPSAGGSYAQWESHWLVCADAMRKAMADVNQNYGKSLALRICGPVTQGPYWDYSLPDPAVDPHGWGSVAWKKIHTDIYGNEDLSIWNFGMYDYHRYRTDGAVNEAEIATLRRNIATASNAPNATIPLLITEYNTSTGGNFTSKNLDTEDLTYGIATAQILQATAILGTNGLGDEGGFFLFKLGDPATGDTTLGNKTAYASAVGDYNYGGVTRGGACFQMYARHFRGGKPLLGNTVTSGSSSKRRVVAVLDEQRQAYYVYFSNVNGTYTTVSLNLSALDVQTNAPVTVQRVDANNTGQITDYLAVDAAKKITFGAPNNTAVLVWIPKANSAGSVIHQPPANDTYLVVGEAPTNHGVEAIMKVSLHHSLPAERRLGFVQFNLGGLTNGNRHLLRLSGRNIGTDPGEREILHLYGAGGAGWSETNLTWATAPGVGKYYTSTNTMAATTGLGSMVDIEDNYRGTPGLNDGKGLGLHGKFLGPVSFYSADWATNYVDVTDYVKSLISSNQTQATFVIARIVRYDVNQYSNSYYAQGVYDSDGRIVEIASKENSNPASRPALVAWPRGSVAPVFTADPISKANATEDVAYTGQTLAGSATDADGDPLTYSKVSGPAWLSIAASGTLSGTPGNSDVGTNSWTVQVSDGITNDTATLKITVINASVATNPTNITGVVSNSTLTLSWPADHLGWILQAQTNHAGLGTNWVDVAGSSSSTIYNIPISPANPGVFFRLRSP